MGLKTLSASLIAAILATSCSHNTTKTVDYLEPNRFMGAWYVQAGRFTFMEKNVYNAVEKYTWNEKENRIDVDFQFNQGASNGPIKKIPQKAWIENKQTNATWSVSPFWPLKFGYLVIALDKNYEWTAIGVAIQILKESE